MTVTRMATGRELTPDSACVSQPVGSDDTVVSIAFADVTLRQGKGQVVVDDVEDSEAIRLEVSEDGTCQV